jgi:hypothetical protein
LVLFWATLALHKQERILQVVQMKHLNRYAPETGSGSEFSGYPAILKAGYRIFSAGRIPDIQCSPDTSHPAGFVT